MLDKWTLETFTPLVQTVFRVQPNPDHTVELVLETATDLGSSQVQERFSLLLRGPLDQFLEQGMYPMIHNKLGSFELFIVPIRQEPTGFVYQAAFNRLL